MKFVFDKYAIGKTQVDYILKSDKFVSKQCTRIYTNQHKEQYKQIFTGAHVRYRCMYIYCMYIKKLNVSLYKKYPIVNKRK